MGRARSVTRDKVLPWDDVPSVALSYHDAQCDRLEALDLL
jgi:hypothetical protein